MKFEKITPGMVLYDVHSYRMGNTTTRSLGTWTVKVLEVDAETRSARVSWNGNTPQWYSERQFASLKDKKPVLIRTTFGAYRRPTREELKEIRAKQKDLP